MEQRIIRVAAAQFASKLGNREENIKQATPLVANAAERGAEMIFLPEMSLHGYTLTEMAWRNAEPEGGPGEQWVKETARRLGVFLGAGLSQYIDGDFYNTYLIADSGGEIIGRVHKTQTEYNIYREGALESHICYSRLGLIGVGICADNHKTLFMEYLRESDIDLLVMPHAWPTPFLASGFVKPADVIEAENQVRNYSKTFASLLGVPTVFVDQVGSVEGDRWPGISGRLMALENYWYPGLSSIADSDGSLKARLEEEAGIIMAEVTLDPSRKKKMPLPDYYGWTHPGSRFFRRVILAADIWKAKQDYARRIGGESLRRRLSYTYAHGCLDF